MSQTKKKGVPSKLVIRNKAPGTLSSGANTEVLLDGKPLKSVSFLKVEVKPAKMTKVTLEMYCDVELEADVEMEPVQEIEDPTNYTLIGDTVYTVGRFESAGIAIPVKPKNKS